MTAVDVAGKKCLVAGAGASGVAAATLLIERGAVVTVNDTRTRAELGLTAAKLERLGAGLALEGHDPAVFASADLVVVSPGVPPLPILVETAANGVEVISEVELASRFLEAPMVAITGTNGKSTVTTLVGDMLRRSGRETFVGGNLGEALSSAVGTSADSPTGAVVVELSSFQLERVRQFRPRVAVLLGCTADHLDRYDDFAHYAETKAAIFSAQGEGDHAVLPADDSVCAALWVDRPGVTRHEFAGTAGGVHVEEGQLLDVSTGWRFPVADLGLPGGHNVLNACAAALAARLFGASGEAIADSLRHAEGLPHRAQFVRSLDGVHYVDDSKATNVGAAVAALAGLASPERRAVLIAGGIDKGGSYRPLAHALSEVGRAVVLIGQSTPLLRASLADTGLPIELAETMDEAVQRAQRLARPGDVVLLAPACSSFDMFRSYAARGDAFCRAVQALDGGAAQ